MLFLQGISPAQVSPIARGGPDTLGGNEPNPVALLQTLSCKTCQMTGRLLVFQKGDNTIHFSYWVLSF